MKRTLFTVMIALAVLTGAYSIAGAADGPHTDYRPGSLNAGTAYGGGDCTKGAACHNISPVKFLPSVLDSAKVPGEKDYTNFCIACHNAAGEAHNKSAGSPSSNIYNGSTTILGDSGDSHSWNGKNHNAGTTTPTSTGFITDRDGVVSDGTLYMPSGRVTCQTCHNSMTKNASYNTTQNIENWSPATLQSGTSYTFGYASTKQYLGEYIKVYRSSGSMSKPANTRTKNQYLVDPSEYTYNYSNGTITFNTSQGSNYIYVEIPQPYLRVDNTANAICLDCHRDRAYGSVSHAPGSGAKNGHPVSVNYGHTSGLNDTVKPSATGNVYLESVSGSSKILCTSCHDPHNSASKNGQIMREADDQTLCGDCHKTSLGGYSTAGTVNIHNGSKHLAGPTVCLECHATHDSNNIMLIKNVINGKTINFQNFTGANSFGNDTGSSICEACHAATSHHLSNNTSAGQNHHTGENCIICHSHANGFSPAGGSCDSCHGFPPNPTKAGPAGWADTVGGKHVVHMDYIRGKFGAGLSDLDVCGYCHKSKPAGTHPENLDTAFIDMSLGGGGTFSDGLTIGKSNTADDSCTSVACHSTTGIRYWLDTAAACDSCHEYPGSATNDWTGNNGHTIRYTPSPVGTYNSNLNVTHLNIATAYNASTDTYPSVTSDQTKCGRCHSGGAHMNGVKDIHAGTGAAAGFSLVTTYIGGQGHVAQCTNAKCHFYRKTPNWY